MGEIYTTAITVFLGFFAIMNPIANTAAFAGLAGNRDRSEQVQIAAKALLITFCIIVAFAFLGKAIFHMFGITLAALRITGGVLVFLVGGYRGRAFVFLERNFVRRRSCWRCPDGRG